ncbi:HAMP domain-containing sensor histidine kinase [Streptomyces griseoviridis]|uniref:Sensor-like histidine kinase SenX3 n=2 Tax=Streptomyces griseoviridis TaxID=45398 RepID=A0A918GVH8_STRGD|nr:MULTISPECIES: HAMP domain-containing sensor histidine kinase [Streptomyces]MDP9683094.1 two-component system sensor histidine kinase MtrB [Streptomyces griseoviridis]GGS69874.1 two-component sensor histidine kinase [Streptomyces niveoruber]GGT14509.1 two-component sensor histidine kinase [Streptomyces griseoviridis]
MSDRTSAAVPGAGPRRFLRAALARIPLPLRGLRPRLLTSFVLVAMASSLGTGALAFREARTGVLQQSQDSVINRFRASVDAVAPAIPLAPDQSDLQFAVDQVRYANRSSDWRIMAAYGGHRAYAPNPGFVELSPEMLRSVRDRRVAVFQRMNVDGRPRLVVGMPVTYTSDEGLETMLSGLVMYLEVPQTTEEGYVEAMVRGIERATLVALCLAVVLALLAASGVLRPVRALRRATRRMAAGHLDVRLDVSGSDELADLSQSFNETAAELERTVRELRRLEAQGRRFVADVSHELRTPLAAMSAVTDVLDLEGEGETGEALRLISEGTNRLSGLVNDLMEISRFDAGAAELNRDEIDLAESVRRTVASRWRQEQVETRLPGPGELRARVDPRRLDVVTANLIGNALRHGEPPVRLTMGVRVDGAGTTWAVIEVTDNGPGIAEEDMPHIFERFYKASTSRARSESSGLGLAITAENVRLHGGRIRAANLPSGGAVFTVELPLHRDDTDTAADTGAGGGSTR